MNYNNIYVNLIASRRNMKRFKGDGTYYENHHIIPRCMNGSDEPSNFVLLTAREHFIAHKLLTKIYPDNIKIYWAFTGMCGAFQKRNLKAHEIEDCKKVAGELLKQRAYDDRGYHFNSKVGRFSEEQKQEIVNIFKGTTLEKEIIADMFGVHCSTIIKILKEQGLAGKEIKSIACRKREYRHKLQLLINNQKRPGTNKGISRNKIALEKQRKSISNYWKQVKEGKIKRKGKLASAKPIRILETGLEFPSLNCLRKDFFIRKISKTIVSRNDSNILYHWDYVL